MSYLNSSDNFPLEFLTPQTWAVVNYMDSVRYGHTRMDWASNKIIRLLITPLPNSCTTTANMGATFLADWFYFI